MNTTIKISVASALAFGAVAAHASIALPSTGASDAILFAEVLNSTGSAVASYAGDTGVSVTALIAGSSGSQTVLGSDANLAKLFAADASGDTIQWAVQGGQYTGSANTTNFKPAGAAQFVTTVTASNPATKLAGDNTLNLSKWAGLSVDIGAVGLAGTINGNANGANSVESVTPSTGGVWDYNVPSGTSGWYGNGPLTGNVLGGSQSLFYVTGGGSTGAKVAYSAIGSATLTASGLVLAGSGGGAPVPLPAAVWLLGSGLLGLTGVARRKLKV
jgi:hypothetical protein